MNIRSGVTIVFSTVSLAIVSLGISPVKAEPKMEDPQAKKSQPWQVESIHHLPPDIVMEGPSSKATLQKATDSTPGTSTNWSSTHMNLRR